MNKFITLREPHYRGGEITDEMIYININTISEILPHDAAACRSDADGWASMVITTTGNKYRVVEDPTRIIELITAVEIG